MAADVARILVVDDDLPIRKLLVSLLTESGYTVIEAAHGAAALDLLTDTPVDLVISDVMMPLLDGIHLCRQVKATWQTAVILMSSAPPQSLAAGEDAFIAKPFDLDRFEQLVETVLSSNASGDTAPGGASPDHA